MNEIQERAFNLAAAIEKIRAFRVDESESVSHPWAYHDDDTNSYWLVTSDELAELASVYNLDVNRWAESSVSTAQEYGRRAPRRAS